ncbi:MAG: hypothetical protein MI976_07420 [Pseudomonadales bacterium]|nr:hypothetical protein [Pseudomonadales bacterium]
MERHESTGSPLISYCSTCMNRGEQLRQTLPQNLSLIESLNGKVELCLVNFIKDDEGEEIHKWILQLGQRPWFKYATSRDLEHWHAPTAKNTAHCLGSGDFLINLDCDNFLSNQVIQQLLAQPNGLSGFYFSGFTGGLLEKKIKANDLTIFDKARIKWNYHVLYDKALKPTSKRTILRSRRHNADGDFNGTYGHIGLPKTIFEFLGGYDESFPPMGGQDKDLLWRVSNLEGLELLHIPQPKEELPILNDKVESMKNTGVSEVDWSDLASEGGRLALEAVKKRRLRANIGNVIGVQVQHAYKQS